MRIELTTSSLPRKCSTPELQRLIPSRRFQLPIPGPRHDTTVPGQVNCQLLCRQLPIDYFEMTTEQERKTRFEPATYSLEGCRSTNWATSANEMLNFKCWMLTTVNTAHDSILKTQNKQRTVGKDGFEPPNSEEDRFTVCCRWPLGYLPGIIWSLWGSRLKSDYSRRLRLLEPEKGLEPPTSWLQISCSTNWATLAGNFKTQSGKNSPSKWNWTAVSSYITLIYWFFWEGKGKWIC